MKNILSKSISVLLLLVVTSISAQDFQGKAVYQTKTSLNIDLAGSGIPADRIKMIKERMKGQLEKTFILSFGIVCQK